jgi:L-threonylcarbamoyladenylate synthase
MIKFISVDEALPILKSGGIVAVPTETVYGLAADATNPTAVEKIFRAKNRPADNPLICHFHSAESIAEYTEHVEDYVSTLMNYFSPGPLSFLLALKKNSSLLVATRNSQNVIARIPAHPLFLELLKKMNKPLAAPSANKSGGVSATTAEMVADDLGKVIDGIIDGGKCEVGLESTILDCTKKNEITILRPGVIGKSELLALLPDYVFVHDFAENKEFLIPGNKYRHYSPKKNIYLLNDFSKINAADDFCILTVDEKMVELKNKLFQLFPGKEIKIISFGSLENLSEIAKNLYEQLNSIDSLHISFAYITEINWENSSLGKTIENRLLKAISA